MSVCAVCGRKGRWRGHHPIGKDNEDRYLDPDLIMELCHDHHQLCHDDWHTFDLEKVKGRLTLIERVELALRRLAPALARVDAGGGGDTFWGRLAATCVMLAVALRRVVDALDELFPEWRSHPVFYEPEGL